MIFAILFMQLRGIHCMNRTGIPTFWGIKAYLDMNNNEWKVLFIGILIFFLGLIGHSAVKDKYGEYTTVTDINGNVEFYDENWIKYESQKQ
jgi:hypothetical protein